MGSNRKLSFMRIGVGSIASCESKIPSLVGKYEIIDFNITIVCIVVKDMDKMLFWK